ncbi:hypothetical protein PG984_013570 [Apiospora sp. TS-2023a]
MLLVVAEDCHTVLYFYHYIICIQASPIPGKRRANRNQRGVKVRCHHPQVSSSSLSGSTTVSNADPLPTGCVDEAQLSSACSCAYVTATTVTGSAPTIVTTVTLTQNTDELTVTATETLSGTDVLTETEVLSTTQTSTTTESVTTSATITKVVGLTTTETDTATSASTVTFTATAIVDSTTVATLTETTVAVPTVPACGVVPLSSPQPTFYILVANGTAAGDYLLDQGATLPEPGFLVIYSKPSRDRATPFSIDNTGALFSTTNGRLVYFKPYTAGGMAGSEVGLFTVDTPPAQGSGYRPLYVQADYGPSCPATSGSLTLRGSGQNGAYNSFVYCNGVAEVSVDGKTSCAGGGNVGYNDALNFVII